MLRGINRKDIFEDGLLTDIIQSLEKTKRNVVLRSALSFGAGIRQLSRLTGISFGVIQKLKNDQERSALPLSLSVATERTDPANPNVNKVETAVRAIHVPTGITVLASDERSQTQNKKLARERLIMKLSAMEEEKQLQQTHAVWMNHNTLERGNPVKKFKGDL